MMHSVLVGLAAPLVWGVLQAIGGAATNALMPQAAKAVSLPTGYLLVALVMSVGYSLASGAATAVIACRWRCSARSQ